LAIDTSERLNRRPGPFNYIPQRDYGGQTLRRPSSRRLASAE
jgi:hypothetical protein